LVQVKPSSSDNPNVVVVAINVLNLPQSEAKNYVFCSDICDTISWMTQLGSSRTNTSYGYLFCCSVEEAARKIPELPQIFRRRPRTTTTLQTTRRTTQTIFVTRTRRTTFAPFPCRQIHQTNVQSPTVTEVMNADDLVLDSTELELPELNYNGRTWSLLGQNSYSKHWEQGWHQSKNCSGRHSVEKRHWGHRHSGEERLLGNSYSGETRNWGSSESDNNGAQLQGSLEKVPSVFGGGSQEENSQIWDFFWAGDGSHEKDNRNTVHPTSDQQEQTSSTVVGDQQYADNPNQQTVQSDNPIQEHRRKVLKGHVVGFVNKRESPETTSLLEWKPNKSHYSREIITPGEAARVEVIV
jgi:hypothetical protein